MTKSLEDFYEFLQKDVAPNRALLDGDVKKLQETFMQMAKHHVLGMVLPKSLGGLDLDPAQRHEFVKNITRASGALMLLQTQHQSIQGFLQRIADDSFKEKWLAKSCTGKYRIGIGFSHLNQLQQAPVTAIEQADHYLVNGIIRYATGFTIFNYMALGFVCAEEEFIALVPFETSSTFSLLETLNLIAANATRTSSFKLENHQVAKQNIFYRKPRGSYHEANVLSRLFPSVHVGTMFAALDTAAHHPLLQDGIGKNALQQLMQEIFQYEQSILTYPMDQVVAPLRIEGLMLLQKIFLFLDQVFRGAATLQNHPLLLIKKEAQLFSALAAETEMFKAVCKAV